MQPLAGIFESAYRYPRSGFHLSTTPHKDKVIYQSSIGRRIRDRDARYRFFDSDVRFQDEFSECFFLFLVRKNRNDATVRSSRRALELADLHPAMVAIMLGAHRSRL